MRTYRFCERDGWLTKDGACETPYEAYLSHLGIDEALLVYEDDTLVAVIDAIEMLKKWRAIPNKSYVTGRFRDFLQEHINRELK